MSLPYDLLQTLQNGSPPDAWAGVFDYAWSVCHEAIPDDKAASEVTRRDRALADLDLYLATAGWDLWTAYESAVSQTADALADWWQQRSTGRAVLILDALSLREVPWLIAGAKARGYDIHAAKPTGAELPPDTTPFAKALGFGQRSSLSANGAGGSHKLPGATTETTHMDW